MAYSSNIIAAASVLLFLLAPSPGVAQVPNIIAAPNATKILDVHAEGAQIYECKAGKDGKLAWQFREPIAALMLDGKTIGRHYLGPTWELSDGSAVTGTVAAHAPGATAKDVPWLKLDASSHRGIGQLSSVTTIQRINTAGGAIEGDCAAVGTFASVTYSSEYIFLK